MKPSGERRKRVEQVMQRNESAPERSNHPLSVHGMRQILSWRRCVRNVPRAEVEQKQGVEKRSSSGLV